MHLVLLLLLVMHQARPQALYRPSQAQATDRACEGPWPCLRNWWAPAGGLSRGFSVPWVSGKPPFGNEAWRIETSTQTQLSSIPTWCLFFLVRTRCRHPIRLFDHAIPPNYPPILLTPTTMQHPSCRSIRKPVRLPIPT